MISQTLFDSVDRNCDVTETLSIASMNGLNPSETTSIMHVELCPETHVEPNVVTSRKPVLKSIRRVNPICQKTLEKYIFVIVGVDDINEPLKLILFNPANDSVVVPSHVQIESIVEHYSEKVVQSSRTLVSPVSSNVWVVLEL
jgi:hypothetical protein